MATPEGAKPEKKEKSLIEQLLPQPLHVHSVKIDGNECTDREFIDAELRHAGLYTARTLKEVAQRAAAAQHELRDLGIFESVDIALDAGPPVATLGAQAAAGAGDAKHSRPQPSTVVNLKVKERRRFGAKAEVLTTIQTSERTLRFAGIFKNAFGRGETVEGSVKSTDDFLSRGFDLQLSKPRVFGSRHRLRAGVFDAVTDSSRYSSFRTASRGLRLHVADSHDRHEFGYEASYREVSPAVAHVTATHASIAEQYIASPSSLNVSQPASVGVLAHARPTVKSALNYRFTADGRDSKTAPTTGGYLSLYTELAGLGGDVDHLKAELDLQKHFAVTKRFVCGGQQR